MMANAEYLAAYPVLSREWPGQADSWLQAWREDNWRRFSAAGFPAARDEDWRYTNLGVLRKALYLPVAAPARPDITAYCLPDAWRAVFVNGLFSLELSELQGLPDAVSFQALTLASPRELTAWQDYLGRAGGEQAHNILAFGGAWLTDGLLLQIAAGGHLDRPLQILHVVTAPQALAATRHVVALAAGASAQIVETFVGQTPDYFTASAAEAFVGPGASLEWIKLQSESDKAQHYAGLFCQIAEGGSLTQHNFALGGQMARTDVQCDLARAAGCRLYGLSLGAGVRQVDNFTRIVHREPAGISRQYYKGIMDGRARGVFQGRVLVEQAAQQTDSQMQNRNLLLSADAEVDSKPQLEIYADDVKCSHGLTVGQLDEQSLFYLQSRGLGREEARHLLTQAFANEMLAFIEAEPLRAWVRDRLAARFPALAEDLRL